MPSEIDEVPPSPDGFDENPPWTAEMWAAARPASEVHGPEFAAVMVRKPDTSGPNLRASVALASDVVAALRATGPGWETRADDVLRAALGLAAERKRA